MHTGGVFVEQGAHHRHARISVRPYGVGLHRLEARIACERASLARDIDLGERTPQALAEACLQAVKMLFATVEPLEQLWIWR